MSRGFSLYIDALRFLTACLVAVSHLFIFAILGWQDFFLGADAVIAFFVISGFVIAWVADQKEADLPTFAAARLSRLWSVLLPAMIITLVLDGAGLLVDASRYIPAEAEAPPGLWTILPSIFFVNEIWSLSIAPMSNQPVWSLSYEFWYYALFGAYFYLRGTARWIAVMAVVLIAGPKILLLLPAWLMGVALYRKRETLKFRPVLSALLAVGTVNLALAFESGDVAKLNHLVMRYLFGDEVIEILGHSTNFIWLNYIALLVTLHLGAVYSLLRDVEDCPKNIEAIIRWLANRTFAIYLLHLPIMLLWSTVVRAAGYSREAELLAPIIGIAASCVIGGYLERLRFPLRRAITPAINGSAIALRRLTLSWAQRQV